MRWMRRRWCGLRLGSQWTCEEVRLWLAAGSERRASRLAPPGVTYLVPAPRTALAMRPSDACPTPHIPVALLEKGPSFSSCRDEIGHSRRREPPRPILKRVEPSQRPAHRQL